MCTNGINTSQLKTTLEQIDETIALTRRWTHRMYHLADAASFERSAQKLKAIQSLLDEVRAELDEAQACVDKDDEASVSVSVNLM